MSYKKKEERLAKILSLFGSTVTMAESEFCPYDAYTDVAIMEFKVRDKSFNCTCKVFS